MWWYGYNGTPMIIFCLLPDFGAEQVPGNGQVYTYAPISLHVGVCSAHCWLQSQNQTVFEAVRTNSVMVVQD